MTLRKFMRVNNDNNWTVLLLLLLRLLFSFSLSLHSKGDNMNDMKIARLLIRLILNRFQSTENIRPHACGLCCTPTDGHTACPLYCVQYNKIKRLHGHPFFPITELSASLSLSRYEAIYNSDIQKLNETKTKPKKTTMEKTRQLLNSTQIMIGNNKIKIKTHTIWVIQFGIITFFLSVSINDHCPFNSLCVVNWTRRRERELRAEENATKCVGRITCCWREIACCSVVWSKWKLWETCFIRWFSFNLTCFCHRIHIGNAWNYTLNYKCTTTKQEWKKNRNFYLHIAFPASFKAVVFLFTPLFSFISFRYTQRPVVGATVGTAKGTTNLLCTEWRRRKINAWIEYKNKIRIACLL